MCMQGIVVLLTDMFHATQNGSQVKFIDGALLCITQSKYLDELRKDKKDKFPKEKKHKHIDQCFAYHVALSYSNERMLCVTLY